MAATLLNGERALLAAVVANLADDSVKLIYADWLEEHKDSRAGFVRDYVRALQTMDFDDIPNCHGLPEEWLELIGYRLLFEMGCRDMKEKEPYFRLARPALRMKKAESSDSDIPVGASKIGGQPDLPADFPWPPGGDCHAIYNDDTGGTDRLAGFLAQVNLAEIADTQAARDLPSVGVLSFFCFQDIENDDPDAIGAKAVYFPDPTILTRTKPPRKLTEGNTAMPAQRLTFEETLDLPGEDNPCAEDVPWDYDQIYEHFRELNRENMLGYARATTGSDPTPSKDSRHLIRLDNAAGCNLHIQIRQDDLAALNFDKITLNWVDFD